MARKAYEEAIRIYLETEGQAEVDGLRKALGELGETSSASAAKAERLVAELDQLSKTSTNIRNFTALKAALSETGSALGKAKDNLDKLRTEFALAEKPTRAMESAMAKAERQVISLTKTQNKQTADLARTSGALRKAGVDTTQLASAYADLQGKFGDFAGEANAMAGAMASAGRNSRAAADGVAGLGASAKAGASSVAAIASRLTLVSGAATAAVSALASFTGYQFFKGAVESATTLEDALGQVRAVSGATAEEMVQLREAAEAGGAATRFSALEAAEGLGELARATGSARGAIAALPAALNLAQAAGIGVADAAQFITTTLTQFGLGADQASRVADVLAKAANTTTADVRGLGDALSYAAPLAAQLGIDTEKTVAIIGALADQGFRGERAGTALRSVFSEMLDPASAFGKALRDLGIESSDFATVIAGLANAGDRGKEAILELDTAARPAILSLVNTGGAALRQLDVDLRAAGGSAAATAAIMADSVAGANEAIRDTFERTRQALVEPLLEPLRNELFTLAGELEAFARSPEFDEIKGALSELFTESAAAARELIAEIDFKKLAVSIREFVGDASSAMAEFRENIGLIVAVLSQMGSQFSVTFNAIQTIVLGLGAGVSKVLELVTRLQLGISAIPRSLLALATGSDEVGQRMGFMADVLGKVSEDLTSRTGKNLGETVNAVRELGTATEEVSREVAERFTGAADASDKLTVAASHQAQASKEAAIALEAQGKAAEAAGGATEGSANQMDRAAERLKNAFQDLGIQSQTNLQRAAESAKKNFELIRRAAASGGATAEDARRAFAKYAEAARAAVADSDASARTRVESELQVLDAIVNNTRSLDDMGKAGLAGGKAVAAGANEAAAGLEKAASAAKKTGGAVAKTGMTMNDAREFMAGGGVAARDFSFSMGVLSEAMQDAMQQLDGYAGGNFLQRFANVTNELTRQRDAARELSVELGRALAKYDENAERREQLRQQFTLLNDAELDAIIQSEQKVAQAKAALLEKQRQANEDQRQTDLQRLEVINAEKDAAAVERQTAPAGEQTLIIDWRAPSKSVATTASARELEEADRLARLVAPRVLAVIQRSKNTSIRRP